MGRMRAMALWMLFLAAWAGTACAQEEQPKPKEGEKEAARVRPDRAMFFQGGPMTNRRYGGGATDWIERQMAWLVGQDAPVKIDQLGFGAEKRMVLNLPVGGVDNFETMRDGWGVEEIFTLTDEQSKALGTLREEYAKDLEKLQQQLDEANKAVALQVVELRKQYEAKANGLLPAEAKAEKEKLDALAREFYDERLKVGDNYKPDLQKLQEETTKKLAEARENQDWRAMGDVYRQGQEVLGKVRDVVTEMTNVTYGKMVEALSGDAQAKVKAEIEKLQARQKQEQDMRARWQQGRPGGERPQGEAEKPPAPQGDNF
ncbi:MAG: hypothetical protein M5U26_08010 [Planctomycetota bacterium]|nr:hypothetical protein [Planctomycetota bacterium]